MVVIALIIGIAFLAGVTFGVYASRRARHMHAFGAEAITDAAELNAYVCGLITRSLATEAFERSNIAAMRDHDEMVRHWQNEPGWLEGYMEATQ